MNEQVVPTRTRGPTRGCSIAPVHRDYRDTSQRLRDGVDLGNGVFLSVTPSWLLRLCPDPFDEHLGEFVFAVEYDAGASLEQQQDRAYERIFLANLALWIARPSSIGFELVMHWETEDNSWDSPSDFIPAEYPPLQALERYENEELGVEDFQRAKELSLALDCLPRDSAIWMAVWALWKALTEDWWVGRYLLTWTALEALFGSEEAIEITYRLAQRMAFFLASDTEKRQDLFRDCKDCYKWRSKMAHGLRLNKLTKEKSANIMYTSEELIRKAMTRILSEPNLIQTFSGQGREGYLESLVFSESYQGSGGLPAPRNKRDEAG